MKPGNMVFAILAMITWATLLLLAPSFHTLLVGYFLLLTVGFVFLHYTSVKPETLLYQIAFVAVLGPVGAIAGAVMLTASSLQKPREREERLRWYRELSGQRRKSRMRDVAKDIEAERLRPQFASSLKSAHEIILTGTAKEKRDILKWIVRRRDPTIYPLLEIAVKGPDPIVRSQAAAILVRLRREQVE